MDQITGQSQAVRSATATNALGCPDYCDGTEFGSTSPYTFDIPEQLTAGHRYQFQGGGYDGEFSLVQVGP